MSSIDYFIILSKIILPSELSVEKFFYAHIEIKYIEVKIAMKKKKFYGWKKPETETGRGTLLGGRGGAGMKNKN